MFRVKLAKPSRSVSVCIDEALTVADSLTDPVGEGTPSPRTKAHCSPNISGYDVSKETL